MNMNCAKSSKKKKKQFLFPEFLLKIMIWGLEGKTMKVFQKKEKKLGNFSFKRGEGK